jgi:hypothetical protein
MPWPNGPALNWTATPPTSSDVIAFLESMVVGSTSER